jgi:2-amino-4-hydroxy-6-hydroxymethyldihydropteridine diphosphokinase
MTRVFLALGSNIGKRQAALRAALERLKGIPGTHVTAIASFRETKPVDCEPTAGKFINSVAELTTDLGAAELYAHLSRIERELGRDRSQQVRHSSRTIDLDLLLFGDEVVMSPELVIPHPRMHLRLFVLEPLVEIAPDVRHPILGKTARQMLAELEASLQAYAGKAAV